MPRSIAVASSAWHIIGSTTATFALTSKPAGTQRSEATISWYSSTHSFASSGWDGRFLKMPPRNVVPKPVQRPHLEEAPVPAGEGLLDHHPGHGVERLVPLLAL